MSKQIITGLEPGEVSRYAFLCGEPERVPKIASSLSDARKIRQAREYTVYGGTLDGTAVTVASTGIGGPSTAILIEEMSNLGANTFIRIGTSGGIADGLEKGDFVIATGAVRADGTSRSYAWPEYPAVADHEIVTALVDSAVRHKARFDVGICFSVDGFYSENKVLLNGKVASMSQSGYMPSLMVDRLADVKKMGVKNIEMENGTDLHPMLPLRAEGRGDLHGLGRGPLAPDREDHRLGAEHGRLHQGRDGRHEDDHLVGQVQERKVLDALRQVTVKRHFEFFFCFLELPSTTTAGRSSEANGSGQGTVCMLGEPSLSLKYC